MQPKFFELISELLPSDMEKFFITVDEVPDKSPQGWQRIAARLDHRYAPQRLAAMFEALCSYFQEPRTTTTMSLRVLYELPISPAHMQSFPFMNLGYHPTPDGPPLHDLELQDKDRKFRCNIAMYRLWLRPDDIAGKDVVEVGSGRGAGASFLHRYFKPRSYTAVDGCRQQTVLCSELYPGIKFVHGHAQALPLADASVDLALNVESSHCYSDLDKFLAEVHRVLRKDGTFVLTDILYGKAKIFAYLHAVERYFDIRGKADITANVVACLEAHGADQFAEAQKGMPTLASARIFLPLDIAPFSNYRALAIGDSLYVSFLCRKRG